MTKPRRGAGVFCHFCRFCQSIPGIRARERHGMESGTGTGKRREQADQSTTKADRNDKTPVRGSLANRHFVIFVRWGGECAPTSKPYWTSASEMVQVKFRENVPAENREGSGRGPEPFCHFCQFWRSLLGNHGLRVGRGQGEGPFELNTVPAILGPDQARGAPFTAPAGTQAIAAGRLPRATPGAAKRQAKNSHRPRTLIGRRW